MTDEVLKAQVDTYVDENWENIIEDIRYLVQVESVEDLSAAEAGKPWGPKSFEALRRGLELAERLGLKTTNVDGYLGFGDLPGKSQKYIATIAHTDIVPLGLGWTADPLDVTRKDGYLLGRGVLDDKGPFVLSLWATHFFVEHVKKTGKLLPYTLRAIVGNNEETGMGDVPYYLERYPEPAFCFTPDAEFPLICGEKGVYHGEFTSAAIAGEKIVELDGGTVPNAIPGLACALVRADAATLPQAPHIDIEDAGVDDQGNHLTRISAHGKGGHASMPLETVNAIGLLDAYLLEHNLCSDTERAFLEFSALLCSTTDGTGTNIQSSKPSPRATPPLQPAKPLPLRWKNSAKHMGAPTGCLQTTCPSILIPSPLKLPLFWIRIMNTRDTRAKHLSLAAAHMPVISSTPLRLAPLKVPKQTKFLHGWVQNMVLTRACLKSGSAAH